MFGALNRFIGRLEGEPAQQASSNGDNSFGFQVLRNKDSELPLEPWFDFIIGINGRLIVSRPVGSVIDLSNIPLLGRPRSKPLRYGSPQLRRFKRVAGDLERKGQ